MDNIIDHSIGTAYYASILAVFSGFSRIEIDKVIIAGLLHDIGKLLVPNRILFSTRKLSDKERSIIKKHSANGYDISKEYIWLSEDIRLGIKQHHENYDGTGYPEGLLDNKINNIGHILHIADVYDALIRTRTYKKSWQPQDAYDYIVTESGHMFSPKYVEIFKNNIPIYEVGALVRLSDNSLAIVVHNNQSNILKPIVMLIENNKELDISQSELTINSLVQC